MFQWYRRYSSQSPLDNECGEEDERALQALRPCCVSVPFAPAIESSFPPAREPCAGSHASIAHPGLLGSTADEGRAADTAFVAELGVAFASKGAFVFVPSLPSSLADGAVFETVGRGASGTFSTVKFGNVLFHNLGNGKFKDVSKEAGLDYVGHSSSAVFFDFDNDGLLDLFVVNIGIYTSGAKNPDGSYVGLKDAFPGTCIPSGRSTAFCTRTWAASSSRM